MLSTTYYKLILIQIIKEEELKSCTVCRESLARSQLQQKIPGLIPGGNTDPHVGYKQQSSQKSLLLLLSAGLIIATSASPYLKAMFSTHKHTPLRNFCNYCTIITHPVGPYFPMNRSGSQLTNRRVFLALNEPLRGDYT